MRPLQIFQAAARSFVVSAMTAVAGFVTPAAGQNPPPTQTFYVPFREDHQLTAFKAISAVPADPVTIFVTLAAATDGTVIYYDHWEDGFETDITEPIQSTTLIFGDGNPLNGFPPGNPADVIPAGTVFNLRNFVPTTNLGSQIKFDGGDKIASYKPISVTKTAIPSGTNTLLAGCVEVFERGLWGTEYRVPVGEDMPTTTATTTLAADENLFSYTAVSVMAGRGGAVVQIDKDNAGGFEETVTLMEGQSILRGAVNTGGRILSDRPVQVTLFTGTVGSNYASRDTMLLPTYRWSNEYFAPVTTAAGDGTVTFLYNPSSTAITVFYDYRSSNSTYTTASVSVPAGGNARVNMLPANGINHFGAYRFYTTGTNPASFYAISAIDADAASGGNQAWDGGFTLVARPSLTTQALVSLGIGRDPFSSTSPSENGNPVWITTVGNGHIPATVYVDLNGDNAGSLTDPNGNRYDVSYSLRELQQQKIYDPDGDQSGMLIYTLDPAVRIAAAWGQDPATASAAQPGLDVASLVPPLREGDAGKGSTLLIDADGDGYISAGDTMRYDLRAVSSARTTIPGPFTFQDTLPASLIYVPQSARYRFMIGGSWQAWTSIPDDGAGTPFPLDGPGIGIPGSLAKGQELQVGFDAVIAPASQLVSQVIENTGQVEISPYGLFLPVSCADTVHGSLGDRVWNDLNGNGVQEVGEPGIPGIRVFLDLNQDGVRGPSEPVSITDSTGNYAFRGLTAGTYLVRLAPSDIAAANVGYGPSYDVDGIATSHSALVTLGIAQDRVDADFGYRVGASVGDRVWMDLNNDRIQSAGEPGINGVRVYLDLNQNNVFDPSEPNAVTSGDGAWSIGNLNPGTYEVRVDTSTLPAGASQTHDLNGVLDHEAVVTLVGAEHRADLDFGYRGSFSIGDLVWNDEDSDGIRNVYSVNRGRIDINRDGVSDNLDNGWIGSVRIINGYVDSNNSNSISSADNGTFQGYTLISGALDLNGSGGITTTDTATAIIIGEFGILGARVYLDMNGNGVFEGTEPSAVTNASGSYSIGNLLNGTYQVRVDTSTLSSSFIQTWDLELPHSDHKAAVTISGANRTDADFGYTNDATLGSYVWNDRNANGVRDAGEPGIAGVMVYVDADNDDVFDAGIERYAITDVDGLYQIRNLPAGDYVVRVEFSTLPQGSVQTYDLTGTLDHEATRTLARSEKATNVNFGYRATATVGDLVWNDGNADGVLNAGEAGISGVRVYLDINGNGTFDPSIEPSSVTNSSGIYSIGNLVPGTYTARIDLSTLPVGLVPTFDASGGLDHAATFSISANQTRTDIDFAYTAKGMIGDRVWLDANANGRQDLGEPGLPNVGVTVFRASNDTIAGAVLTDSSGAYSFADLMPGTYYVVFDPVIGHHRSLPDIGDESGDSDAALTTGRTAHILLLGGQTNQTIDAGYYVPGSIHGHLYIDTNGNGVQDQGEANLAAVDVIITDANGAAQVVSTDALGNWSAIVPPGPTTADVDETDPDYPHGYIRTEGNDPTAVTAISAVAIDAGNDGYFLPASIRGFVYRDANGLGTSNLPLGGVTLRLLDSSGNPVLNGAGVPTTVVTMEDGSYAFGGLPPGIYRVVQDQPSGFASVSDVDGANDNLIGLETPIILTPGDWVDEMNFLEIQLGSIAGTVRTDTTGDGSNHQPLAGVLITLLDGSGIPVLDGANQPLVRTTGADGGYLFSSLLPGNYQIAESQPTGYASVSDVDGGDPDLIGNITALAVAPGQDVTGRDFLEIQLGSIAGTVRTDTTGDGSNHQPLAGVLITLLDGSGNPVLDGANQPLVRTTGADGAYLFSSLLPGNYRIAESQPTGYASVSDVDGGNPDLIGDITPLVVAPGQNVTGRDFLEVEFGTISGYVYVGAAPLSQVTLILLDASGNPVDGDPSTPGIQAITTTTDGNGFYQFPSIRPGSYQIGQIQPSGYDSFGDADGGDLDVVGDVTPIIIQPGQTSENNNFVESLDICPNDWPEWQSLHPGESADGNPDGDMLDNLAEFAFAQRYDSGAGDPFRIRSSELIAGTVEGVFIRPNQATNHVTYVLEYASALGVPTVWQSMALEEAHLLVVDHGDCTETVVIPHLESLTGLIGGEGFVRIRAELDEDQNHEVDHVSRTAVEGWSRTPVEICCRTYNNAFLRDTVFDGLIDAASGETLDVQGSAGPVDIGELLLPGVCYFAEITSGPNEGHRFDVATAADGQVMIEMDTDLVSGVTPHNTLSGALPANLAGSRVVIRRHWTLGELFPPQHLGADSSQSTADQVQLHTAGVWSIYWLYDHPDGPRWVTGATLEDQSNVVIPPGRGMFFNSRHTTGSLLSLGEVRGNRFARPLSKGSNLMGGGYPVDQNAVGGRAMTPAQGFKGSRDFKKADRFYIWKGDVDALDHTYTGYFLLDGSPVQPSLLRWTRIADTAIQSQDSTILFQGDRAVFMDLSSDIFSYSIPTPWTP